MKFRRNLLSRVFRNSDPDADSGGGGFADTPATEQSTGAEAAEGSVATGAEPQAGSMLEAMFGQQAPATDAEKVEAAATGKTVAQLRDEKGRFAGKAPADPNQPDPTKPPVKADPNQMPEGLTPKAQERFQALANTNKELTTRVTEWEPIVNSALALQDTFREHGVKREQFEQAMEVVGLMNRGDLEGALRALDEQRSLISMALGRPVPGADPLARFPDLRGEVDNLQMTEARALEIARYRTGQQQQQRQDQQRQDENRRQQEEQQAVERQQQDMRAGQVAVDKFAKEMAKTDLDFARIEPLLLQQIQEGLLEGVPPQRWAALIQKTYGLIKQTASQSRSSASSAGVLRPTGGESPRQTPKTMHEAMWSGR
jgi:hypothetical protein